ncbi:hypothetical protein Ancab_018633 [Ancistrocladus abbreviatus]
MVDGQSLDIMVYEETTGETIFSRGWDRKRMDVMDSVRITSEDSEVHGSDHRKNQASPVDVSLASLPADIPSTGINGLHGLTEERVHHDGPPKAYTSKSTVNRKRLIDGDGVADACYINDPTNVATSRSNSKSRFMCKKTSSVRREKRSAVGLDVERGLKENHTGHPLEELGSSLDPSVPRVGPSPCTNSADLFWSRSRPTNADDLVSIDHQPVGPSPPFSQLSGPSKASKGRSRIPIITMGRFKIGVKKKHKHQRKGSASRSNEGRNDLIFRGIKSAPSDMFDRAQVLALEWIKARGRYLHCSPEEWVFDPLSILQKPHSMLPPRRQFADNSRRSVVRQGGDNLVLGVNL